MDGADADDLYRRCARGRRAGGRTSPRVFPLIQGVAAGAILTVIAKTMLPEAFLKGTSLVGVSTLFGFLAAIYLKTRD